MLELPPIVKLAERVLLDIEKAVRRFPRYHRYTLGADLRREATAVFRCAHRAWRDRNYKLKRVTELAMAVDDLKLSLQIGKQIEAFGSFGEFEVIAKAASELGRQCGGWLRQLRPKGQNVQAQTGPRQRAQILSARNASSEASP